MGGFEFFLYAVDSVALAPDFRALGGAFYGVFRAFLAFVEQRIPCGNDSRKSNDRLASVVSHLNRQPRAVKVGHPHLFAMDEKNGSDRLAIVVSHLNRQLRAVKVGHPHLFAMDEKNGNDRLAFVLSHPFRNGGEKDGAPAFVVSIEKKANARTL